MSFLLTRIRRALAEPPQEEMTNAVLAAITAHWKCLFDSDPKYYAVLRPHIEGMKAAAAESEKAQQHYVTAALAEWEAKRAAFQLDATLGGPPGQPGKFVSSDWGTHWILFQWSPPQTGGPVWGYRVERGIENAQFCLMDICVEPEVTLLHQPPGQNFYYRVVAFNGWGDGPPSNTFSIKLDTELVDWHKRKEAGASS